MSSIFDSLIFALSKVIPGTWKRRLKRRFSIPDVEWSMKNMRSNGFSPETIIDVGAYKGEWTETAKFIYPDSRVLMVEPQRDKASRLQAISSRYQNVEYCFALLGPEEKDCVPFRLNETVSSVLPEVEGEAPAIEERSMTTLARILTEHDVEQPDFLKLDVQGYEIEVLKGAEHLLEEGSVEAILMEVSLLEINEGAPLFADVCQYMSHHSYQLYDICSFMRRPFDQALWQVDAIFVDSSSDLVASKRWN